MDLVALYRCLARLYPDSRSVVRVATEAGLTTERIDLTGSALNAWFQVVSEAARDNRLSAVLTAAGNEYPRDATLLTLRRELGVLPGPRVRVAASRLPVTGPDLFGRERDLAWLDECWNDGVGVASLVAWGGVGKTTLVTAWRNRLRDRGWQGAERIFDWSFYNQGTTDQMTSADEFVSVALRWFGDPDPTDGSPWDRGERLAELVNQQRTLLILDGLEPLQWGPTTPGEEGKIKDPALQALVRGLAGHNEGLCLITSRLAVKELDLFAGSKVRERKLEHLSPEAGAALLRTRGAAGTDEELQEAAREYGGHCLTLTLLGHYLQEVCGGDVLRRQELGPLAGESRMGGHAERVMAAYERWFGRGPELAVLRMLGLFDRPAGADEIDALRAPPVIQELTVGTAELDERAWRRVLTRLRRAGLLAEQSTGEAREALDAHPLVREHFGERLRREHPDDWREGHRRLYEHLKTPRKVPETLEEMVPLFAAVTHGCRAGLHREVLRDVYRPLISQQKAYHLTMKRGALGADLASLAGFFSSPWSAVVPSITGDDRAWVLNAVGFDLRALGLTRESLAPVHAALKVRLDLESWGEAAHSAGDLSEIHLCLGEIGRAVDFAERSVEYADRSDNAWRRCSRRITRVDALHQAGRHDEAEKAFRDAETLRRKLKQPPFYSLHHYRHCDLLLDRGAADAVIAQAQKRLAKVRPTHWLVDVAHDHLALGRAQLALSSAGSASASHLARRHLREAVERLRRAGVQEYIARGLIARAEFHSLAGEFADASRDLSEARSLSARCGLRLHEADAHIQWTRLHLAQANPAEARASFELARGLVRATGYGRRDAEIARLEAALG